MNYLALARKWRPRKFSELVGQDHVVRALSNALETQRIHHAWLFTGTRGVGKTTLARILAKSLNCETGITAKPCGQCSACLEIDQGRFVDYIEVDAASRRGVDEITPLLEQAIYAPSRGRFKIYTIDEVHMLTTHAFNAMLKTLEEPPVHLKFILATTDPQKIPVTVLSRCIQYNLKQMAPEAVAGHLQHLLTEEGVQFEAAALQLIARGAAGSMRDALSLTDQAIAFSGNHITVQAMQDMLGTIDQSYLVNLTNALLAGDAAEVVTLADAIADRGFSYEGALSDLAILLSRVAMEQKLPGTIDSDDPLYEEMMRVVQTSNHEIVQLFYSIAVHGRKELALAPDEYAGFVMICLRMLALTNAPEIKNEINQQSPTAPVAAVNNTDSSDDLNVKKKQSSIDAEQKTNSLDTPQDVVESTESTHIDNPLLLQKEADIDHNNNEDSEESAPPVQLLEQSKDSRSDYIDVSDDEWARMYGGEDVDDYDSNAIDEPLIDSGVDMVWEPQTSEEDDRVSLSDLNQDSWIKLTKSLNLSGLAGELLLNSQWLATENNTIYLKIFLKNVDNLAVKSTLTTVLTEYFSQVVKLHFEAGETGDATARAQLIREQEERQQQAEEIVANDVYIKSLEKHFDAIVVDGSVRVHSSE